jgi:HlyD family secretion protein
MKKWLILFAVVALVVVVWYVARGRTYTPPWAQPKMGVVSRGDIKVPITAAGLIHARQVIEVKPEASGIIIEVPVVEGTFVRKGDPLLVINPEDEQRARDRAKADFDRSEAMRTQASVAIERAAVSIENSKAQLDQVSAQASMTRYEYEKIHASVDKTGRSQLYSDQQVHDIDAQDRMYQAQVDSARIAVRTAELTKEDAIAALKSQEAVVEAARKTLEDADVRLRKTTVLATQDAIVTQVFVKAGMLVQSGTSSFMGGTQLMNLADVSKKKVIARLDEADYGRVLSISPVEALPDMPELRSVAQADAEQLSKRSGVVKLTVDAFPDKTFEGQVVRVEPQGKLNTGSSIIQFDVHVEITDAQRHMLPLGAQAQVEFTVESAVDTLRVPAEAVKTFEEQRGVWVKRPPEAGSSDKFGKKFIPCRFGISDGEFTQVLGVSGDHELKVDDEVYTKLPQEAGANGE